MRLIILLCCFFAAAHAQKVPENQLPSEVKPLAYDISLDINPQKPNFSGKINIKLRFDKKTNQFWMHGQNLQVKKAELHVGTKTWPVTYQQMSPEGVVLISSTQIINAGEANLRIEYGADYPKDLAGLYKVQQNNYSYVYSQFEPIAARTCFPSFDEPRFKTPFKISLTIPKSDTGISNALIQQELKASSTTKTLIFEETPPLPTYLVAFAVGPFDIVTADPAGKIPLRGIAPKGLGSKLAYALQETPKILKILEDYFGIPYPYSKLDIIAIPDFSAGAMENAGAITFRDSLLLLDPKTAPVNQVRRFAEVMAHELAHQWFGNLVTMRWWEDLWLNEAFASWMATKVMMQYNPSYHADWDTLMATQYAMEQDSLSSARKIQEPILSHHDIYSAFDAITYTKGEAVIDMFEHYITPAVFQKGVRSYLTKYANKNTDTADFISELSKAANQNLAPAFGSFLTQAGVPLITFQYDRYKQSRYLPLGSTLSSQETWQIPFCPQTGSCQILPKSKGTVSDFGFPARDGRGYYRFTGLSDFDLTMLNDSEKIVYIANLKASFRAGHLNTSELLPKLAAFTKSSNRILATAPISTLTWLKEQIDPKNLNIYAQKIYLSKPIISEPEEQKLFEAQYLEFEADIAQNPQIRQELLRKALAYLKNPNSLDSNQIRIALVVLMEEKPTYFKKLTAILFKSQDSIQRTAILQALAESEQALSLVLSKKLRKNEILTLLSTYMSLNKHEDTGFLWLQKNLSALLKILPLKSSGHLPWVLSNSCSEKKAQEIEVLLSPVVKDLPGGPRELKGVLEQVRLCEALKNTQKENAAKFFGN
ncbi:MAG: M1 family metallopeptidase [Myxococcaceae bacterium]